MAEMDMNFSRDLTKTPEDMDEFDAPIPGQSLTDTPEKWAWERPAEISDPEEATDYVIGQIEQNEKSKDEFEKMLLSGMSIESIVNTIAFGGFTEGKWTVDVAELIKLPVTVYLVDFAMKANIPATMFSEGSQRRRTQNTGMNHDTVFALMKQNRPDMYDAVSRGLDKDAVDIDSELSRHENSKPSLQKENKEEAAFIDMEEV